jgi:hypothetical protein
MIEALINSFKSYILTNYQAYLDEKTTEDEPLTAPTELLLMDVDLDKHTRPTEFFMLPDEIRFNEMDMGGNEDLSLTLECYLFLRKQPDDILYLQAIRHMECFKKLVKENPNFGRTIGNVDVPEVTFYNVVEGLENVKCVRFSVTLEDEF